MFKHTRTFETTTRASASTLQLLIKGLLGWVLLLLTQLLFHDGMESARSLARERPSPIKSTRNRACDDSLTTSLRPSIRAWRKRSPAHPTCLRPRSPARRTCTHTHTHTHTIQQQQQQQDLRKKSGVERREREGHCQHITRARGNAVQVDISLTPRVESALVSTG